MRNLASKSIVSALGGHPPNTQLLDIAHGLSGSASRDNIGKAIAGAREHKVKMNGPVISINSGAPPRPTSVSKTISPHSPIGAAPLRNIFRAPNPLRGAGYFAPRGISFAAPALRMAA